MSIIPPKRSLLPLLVGVGGGSGAVARFLIQTALTPMEGEAASSLSGQSAVLLGINALGCVLIGFLVTAVVSKKSTPAWHALLIPGFLGGFTSFSAFIALVFEVQLLQGIASACGYVALNFVVCVFAAWAGSAIGKRYGFPRTASVNEVA